MKSWDINMENGRENGVCWEEDCKDEPKLCKTEWWVKDKLGYDKEVLNGI